VAQIGRIFQSLLQGKWSALDDYFTVKGEGRADRWTITLVPKPQVASFLKGVRVSGGRFIERVHVDEPGGDTMDLTFLNVRTDLPVSPMETRLYSFE
jgi:hypothetical protein